MPPVPLSSIETVLISKGIQQSLFRTASSAAKEDTHILVHAVQPLGICINAGMKDQMISINYLNVSQHLNVHVITFIICIVYYTSSLPAET